MHVWLIQDAEPLPIIDSGARLMRTAMLADCLVECGHSVLWYSGLFDHSKKCRRQIPNALYEVRQNYNIQLIDGPGFKSNISIARIIHQHKVASNFVKISKQHRIPDLILASYPTPELCKASYKYAKEHNVPYVIDFRDSWPDTFYGYLPKMFRFLLYPIVEYYKSTVKKCLRNADARYSVSPGMLGYAQKLAGLDSECCLADKVFYLGYPNLQNGKNDKSFVFTEESPLIFVFIGSGGSSYEHQIVVESARHYERIAENRVRFVLIGNHEIENSKNLEVTGWLNAERIKYYAEQSHIGMCFIKAGILSSGNWIGNKVFEYMSYALALVTNDRGDLSKLIRNENIGFDAIDDVSKFKNLIDSILHDSTELQLKIKNSHNSYLSNYQSQIVYNQYCRDLETITQGKHD